MTPLGPPTSLLAAPLTPPPTPICTPPVAPIPSLPPKILSNSDLSAAILL